jgi:hypothetical protein
MSWVLTKNLTKLREEFNDLGPNRDKASDGSVGDLAHQGGSSGHNPDKTGNAEYKDGDSKDEVRAIDVDKSGPWRNGQTMEKVVQHLVEKGRSGNLEVVVRYIIYAGRIWHSQRGWATETYNGTNGHYEHAHISGAWTQSADENSSYNYGVANLGDTVSAADVISALQSDEGQAALVKAVQTQQVQLQGTTGVSEVTKSWRTYQTSDTLVVMVQSVIDMLTALATSVAQVDEVTAAPLLSKIEELNVDLEQTRADLLAAIAAEG